MESDIAKVLSFEIKKELADRYFGFRKIIEEDKQELDSQVKRHSMTVEQKICMDLVRIYILLKDEAVIQDFLDLAGLEEKMYYDPYFLESPTIRKRVFAGVTVRGFTRKGRFIHLVLDSYATLVEHVIEYIESFGELLEKQETIAEEIKLFYQKNDLVNIMGFLRSLDAPVFDNSMLQADASGLGSAQSLEKKMRLEPPLPIEHILPIIPPLIPLRPIRKNLKKLAKRAFQYHTKDFQVE